MKAIMLLVLCLLILFCHKDIMLQQGYHEIKIFDWKIDESLNKLNVKFMPVNSPIDSISWVLIQIKVEDLELENIYKNPTIKLDSEKGSVYYGQKIVECNWIPSLEITPNNLQIIFVYVK